MAVRASFEEIPTLISNPEHPNELIDLGLRPGREVSCETEDCMDRGIWKLIPDNGNPVICGVCSQIIDTQTEE